MTYTVADITAAMDEFFPPAYAESWDRVGLVAGLPSDEVRSVAFAVDPCEATVQEACERGADLLITHHPLFLRGTSTVAGTFAKGRWVTQLVRGRVALFSAHTNADVVASTAALARLLDVDIEAPLDPESGIGGVGSIAAVPFGQLVERVAQVLPHTPAGVLGAGDPQRVVRRLAICSGSGDSLLAAAKAAGADAYLTADLRHHPATDHIWDGGCALICATHWASEWPVLGEMEQRLRECFPQLDTYISEIPTDAWNIAVRG